MASVSTVPEASNIASSSLLKNAFVIIWFVGAVNLLVA